MSKSPAEEVQEANAETARAWSLGWRTLARAFHGATQQWLEELLDGTATDALSEATRWLGSDRARFADALELSRGFVIEQRARGIQDVLRDIKIEYDRLFSAAQAPPKVPPNESAYRERGAAGVAAVGGAPTSALEKLYQRQGMQPAFSRREMADHIATELEFMYVLSCREEQAWEKGETKTAEVLRRAQLGFMEEHLAPWVPDFCGRVQDCAQSDLYFALAGILREFLAVEACWAYGRRVP